MLLVLKEDLLNVIITFLSSVDMFSLQSASKQSSMVVSSCFDFKAAVEARNDARRSYLIHSETFYNSLRRAPTVGLYNLFSTHHGRLYLNRICSSTTRRSLRWSRRTLVKSVQEREFKWYTKSGVWAWLQEMASRRKHSYVTVTIDGFVGNVEEMLSFWFLERTNWARKRAIRGLRKCIPLLPSKLC